MDSFLTDEAKSDIKIMLGLDEENEYESALTDEAKDSITKLLDDDGSYDSFLSDGVADYIKELLDVEATKKWNIRAKLIPVDAFAENNSSIESIVVNGNDITITGDLSLMKDVDYAEITEKFIAIEIDTGITPITDVSIGGWPITEFSAEYFQENNCASDGFIEIIDFGYLLEHSREIELTASDLSAMTITIHGVNSVKE